MLSSKNLAQIKEKGIDKNAVDLQLLQFKNGFPPIKLDAAATVENKGIVRINDRARNELILLFEESMGTRDILKFVPASGAASRMFKTLFSFREKYDGSEKVMLTFQDDKSFNSVCNFIGNISRFAFFSDLKDVMIKNGYDIEHCIRKNDFNTVIDFLLEQKGLDYSSLPKGLLKFHNYKQGARTAFEEHFVEAAEYARSPDGNASAHFTISPEHISKFEVLLKEVLSVYEQKLKVKFEIRYSVQKSSTDTIAVDTNNEPFLETDGSLLFRPGGHGALLENLNDLKGDIIFIKNIDNIVPDRLKGETYKYKKVLGGYLMKLQSQTWKYLHMLEKGSVTDDRLDEMISFSKKNLTVHDEKFISGSAAEKIERLRTKLNRPMRVCGMVKNEGEPGGGPFWTINNKGEKSLQIVESSQIDHNNTEQKRIFENSTHFNPVDLVCGVRDYKGGNFDLLKYTDPDTGFISVKSKDGRELKALELPGLWNGAMADWITVFVEVPVITFNPVKTVNDLLREEHQM